jgi:hypothetical protein
MLCAGDHLDAIGNECCHHVDNGQSLVLTDQCTGCCFWAPEDTARALPLGWPGLGQCVTAAD